MMSCKKVMPFWNRNYNAIPISLNVCRKCATGLSLKCMNEEITMNIANTGFLKHLSAGFVAALLVLQVGCSSTSKAPDGVADVRGKLLQLQANSQLATLAPVAIKD